MSSTDESKSQSIRSGAFVEPAAAFASDSPAQVADKLFRRESARLVAMLTAQFGAHRLQLAEDVVQEALVRALQTWPYRGMPDNPAAWLTQTAKNLARDFLRREQRWEEKQETILSNQEQQQRFLDSPDPGYETFADDSLRLMFVCFHPQLSLEAQTALALRTLCGFSPAEIASAFLTSESAISKRLVRARQRIRELGIPFTVPEVAELPARLDGVLGTIYLLFNEGYKASSGDRLVREELCREAIRLAELLASHPATRTPKVHALLALMLLTAARLSARTDDAGNLLRLHEQDRSAWDHAMIARGMVVLRLAAEGDNLSEYHLEAGIAAFHSTAVDEASTDWPRILSLYDKLQLLAPSPVVAMNRAVAVARVHGSQAGLEALQTMAHKGSLDAYHLFHAIWATFEMELQNFPNALDHFEKASQLATLPAEREFIARRMRECEAGMRK